MRAQRLVTALVALALLGLVTVGASGSAHAATALPKRDLNARIIKNDKGWLIFKGNVDPGWNDRNVQVYKRKTKDGTFKLVKKVATDGEGRWSLRIYAPRTGYWYWKAVVPKSGGYGKSASRIWRTYVV
jgi:hypothetical protein